MSAASNSLICVRHSHLILATAEPDVCCKLQSHIWRTARPVWRCLYSQCLLIFFLFYHLIFFIGTIRRHSMDRKVQVKPYKQHVIPKSSGGLVWLVNQVWKCPILVNFVVKSSKSHSFICIKVFFELHCILLWRTLFARRSVSLETLHLKEGFIGWIMIVG